MESTILALMDMDTSSGGKYALKTLSARTSKEMKRSSLPISEDLPSNN